MADVLGKGVSRTSPPATGVCVPKNCQDDSDCPEVGNICTTGALTTRECSDKNQCEYGPHLTIAECNNMTGYINFNFF